MKRKLGALEKVDADLPNLQHKIKRDSLSYKDDFKKQWIQYETFKSLYMHAPSSAPSDSIVSLKDLIDFVSHVADCYPDITNDFPAHLATLLADHHEALEPELRDKAVGALVLLRKKDVIDSSTLLNTLFPILIATPSKALRSLLYQKVLSDIRSSNAKTTAHKLNRSLQNALYNLLTADKSSPKGIWAVRITKELWRRQIWTDSKAVDIMKEAALSGNPKVILGAVTYFLGGDKEREEAADDSSGDEEAIDMAKLRHQAGANKKTRKREKDLKIAAATVKKKERKKNKPHPLNFSALHLLHDPQAFAETLFSRHLQSTKSRLNLEQKLHVLQLVSRLVGLHKLTIISLYSYFLRYLTPKQASVTSFLASLAQSTHNLVPPDALEPLILKIANEFVSEASSGQVAAAGLNTIREICARQPLAMSDTLLQDLVMYRKSKDKGVMMAAKGLLSLYREVGADMLKRRDRGREATLGMRAGESKQQRYGETELGTIEGLDELEKFKEEERRQKRIAAGLDPDEADVNDAINADAEDWKNWEAEDEDDANDSGGWIDVQSDGEDINISDSDDEKPTTKKVKFEVADNASKDKEIESITDLSSAVTTQAALDTISLNLATTRILTPADLAKLKEIRLSSAVQDSLPHHKKRAAAIAAAAERHADDPITAESLQEISAIGTKATKEEKIAAAKADRDLDHRSATAKRKEKKAAEGKSTTNKEKARKKNFLMTLGKARHKNKRSLREVGQTLKGHVDRQKRGGKRGNQGQ